MPVPWKQHIVSDPEILRGKPRIKGTRIPVGLVLGYLAAGKTSADILAESLRSFGHEVQIAHDGPEALAIVEHFQPNAAILDIGLPVMDGYELAERLGATMAAATPRLIALTGYGQEHDRLRGRKAGFDEHLVKPVDLKALIAAVDRSLPAASSMG